MINFRNHSCVSNLGDEIHCRIIKFCNNVVSKHKVSSNGCLKTSIANNDIQNSIHKAAEKFGVEGKLIWR